MQFATYLDGKLHRRSVCNAQVGQGEGVTFLELTDAEVASRTSGNHTLAIEVQNPADTISLDAKLLSYGGQ